MKQHSLRPGIVVTATLAMAFSLGGCAQGGGEPEPSTALGSVTFASGQATLQAGVPQLVQSFSLDEQNGFHQRWQANGNNASINLSGLVAGDWQFTTGGIGTFLTARAKGQDLVIVGCHAQNLALFAVNGEKYASLGVTADDPVEQRIRALKGLTIVSTPEGSGFNILLRSLLRHYGLDPETDVTVVGTADIAAMVSGLKQGLYDVGFASMSVWSSLIAPGEAVDLIDLQNGDLADFVPARAATTQVAVTTRAYAQQHPALVEAVYQALAGGADLVRSDPRGAGERMKTDWFPALDAAVFDLQWRGLEEAFPAKAQCEESVVSEAVSLIKDLPENRNADFSRVTFDDMVWKSAQAKG